MNKKLLLITLISTSIIIAGCTNKQVTSETVTTSNESTSNNTNNGEASTVDDVNTNTNNDNSNENSNNKVPIQVNHYEITPAVYTDKNVKINYPQINNLSDINKQNTINQLIKDGALSYIKNGVYDALNLELKYTITLTNSELLSIQYSGLASNKNAAHPNDIFYTTNIDINNGKILRLSDLITIDENFIEAIKKGEYKGKFFDLVHDNTSEEGKKYLPLLMDYINQTDTKTLIKELNQSYYTESGKTPPSSAYYLTKDSIGISLSIPFAIGDHAEFEIKYKDIPNTIITENAIWKSLLNYN